MHAKRLLDDDVHFVANGVDYYGHVLKDQRRGITVHAVRITRPSAVHNHPDLEQVYYIRSGRGLITVDGETKEVERDMVVYIPPGASHGIEPCESDEELIYVLFSHYWREVPPSAGTE